jgi:hypothetical protein
VLPPEPDRFGPQVFPDPSVIRQRLSDNLVEAQLLRRLLKVADDASAHQAKRTVEDPAKTPTGGAC